jgi:hypothetical protein
MAVYEPYEQSFKLKAVGAAHWQMEADWFEHEPNETTLIRFSNKTPAAVRPDDLLLYYATGHQKVFGIVRVLSKPVRDEGEEQWPWSAHVRSKVIIRQLERAPDLDLLKEADPTINWHTKVRQMDYKEITEDVFDHAAAALVALAQPALGDILDDGFRADYAAATTAWTSEHGPRPE